MVFRTVLRAVASGVTVSRAGGISTARIKSSGPISEATLSEAVAEAGYTVVANDA